MFIHLIFTWYSFDIPLFDICEKLKHLKIDLKPTWKHKHIKRFSNPIDWNASGKIAESKSEFTLWVGENNEAFEKLRSNNEMNNDSIIVDPP